MNALSSIEVEYIKNLQKQVHLLELETTYLEKAKKAASIQPKFTREAEKILQKMKELDTTINTMQIEIMKKENATKILEAETQALQRHLQTLSGANTQEKLVLMEDATKLKKLADISIQDISHKEAELLKIQQEAQQTVNAAKEKEHNVHLLETELLQQTQQHQQMEEKHTRSRSECLQLQELLHQLEEKYLASFQSTQQRIAEELCEEAEKLRQALKERELSADEDKYLCDKMAESCGHLTRENGLLQAQMLDATQQLSRERQLREEASLSHSRRAAEVASERERERQLEMELSHLKTLLQDERRRILKAQEQVLHLQEVSQSVDQNSQLLQSQQRDLERRHSNIQLENSKLQIEKTQLVENISHLHEQISEKEKEIHFLYSHVNSLSNDLNNLKSQVDTASALQNEGKISPAC